MLSNILKFVTKVIFFNLKVRKVNTKDTKIIFLYIVLCDLFVTPLQLIDLVGINRFEVTGLPLVNHSGRTLREVLSNKKCH